MYFKNIVFSKLNDRSSSVGTIRLSSYQKRILQNIADDTNSLPHGCNLRKRTKLMMPKEPLLKENSPIKKQLDVPKNTNPSIPNAMNSLFHVSILPSQITLKISTYFFVEFMYYVFINRRKIVLLFLKCNVLHVIVLEN